MGGPEDEPLAEAPRRRVVFIGASNLTRGISTVVETAQLLWNEPLAIYYVAGHGRSYGMASRVVARTLPGVLDSKIWHDLAQAPAGPTAALLTDIGNDLIYGRPVEVVYRWVETCVDRLAAYNTDTILTGLPLEGVKSRPRWQFDLLKQLFFSQQNLRYEDVIERAFELDARLETLSHERGLVRIEPSRQWYGWDPIHIERQKYPVAWQEILSSWKKNQKKFPLATGSFRRWCYLRRLRPAERVWFGRAQHQTQPAGRFPDGTTIALY